MQRQDLAIITGMNLPGSTRGQTHYSMRMTEASKKKKSPYKMIFPDEREDKSYYSPRHMEKPDRREKENRPGPKKNTGMSVVSLSSASHAGGAPYVRQKEAMVDKKGNQFPAGYTLYSRVAYSAADIGENFKKLDEHTVKSISRVFNYGVLIKYNDKWLTYLTKDRGVKPRAYRYHKEGPFKAFIAPANNWVLVSNNLSNREEHQIRHAGVGPANDAPVETLTINKDAYQMVLDRIKGVEVKGALAQKQIDIAKAMAYKVPQGYSFARLAVHTGRDVYTVQENKFACPKEERFPKTLWTEGIFNAFYAGVGDNKLKLTVGFDVDGKMILPVSDSGDVDEANANTRLLKFLDAAIYTSTTRTVKDLDAAEPSEDLKMVLQRADKRANSMDQLTSTKMYRNISLSGDGMDSSVLKMLNELVAATVTNHLQELGRSKEENPDVRDRFVTIREDLESNIAGFKRAEPSSRYEDLHAPEAAPKTEFKDLALTLYQLTMNYTSQEELAGFRKQFPTSADYVDSEDGVKKDWTLYSVIGDDKKVKSLILISNHAPNRDALEKDINKLYINFKHPKIPWNFQNLSHQFNLFNSANSREKNASWWPTSGILSVKLFPSDINLDGRVKGLFDGDGEVAVIGKGKTGKVTLKKVSCDYENIASDMAPQDRELFEEIFKLRREEVSRDKSEHLISDIYSGDNEGYATANLRMRNVVNALNTMTDLVDMGSAIQAAAPKGISINIPNPDGTANRKTYKFDSAGILYQVPSESPNDMTRWRIVPQRIFDSGSMYMKVLDQLSVMINKGRPQTAEGSFVVGEDDSFHLEGKKGGEFTDWLAKLKDSVNAAVSSDNEFNIRMQALVACPTLYIKSGKDANEQASYLLAIASKFDDDTSEGMAKEYFAKLQKAHVDAASVPEGEEISFFQSRANRTKLAGELDRAFNNFKLFKKWVKASYAQKAYTTPNRIGLSKQEVADADRELAKAIEALKNTEALLGSYVEDNFNKAVGKDITKYSDEYTNYMAERQSGLLWRAKEAVMDATLRPLIRFMWDSWDYISGTSSILWDMIMHPVKFLEETKPIFMEAGYAGLKVFFKHAFSRIIEEKFADKEHTIRMHDGEVRKANFKYVREGMKKVLEDGFGVKVFTEQERRKFIDMAGDQAFEAAKELRYGKSWDYKYNVFFHGRNPTLTGITDIHAVSILGKETKPGSDKPSLRFTVDIPILPKFYDNAFGANTAEILNHLDDRRSIGGSVLVNNMKKGSQQEDGHPIMRKWWGNLGMYLQPYGLRSTVEDAEHGGSPSTLSNGRDPMRASEVKLMKDSLDQVHLRCTYNMRNVFSDPNAVYRRVYNRPVNEKNMGMRDSDDTFQIKMNLIEALLGVR